MRPRPGTGRRLPATRLLMLSTLLLLGGCSEDPRQAIVGAWQGVGGVQDLRFHASGQAEIDDHRTGRHYRGHCRIDDEALMQCRFEGFARPVVRRVQLSGDELVLTSRSGQEERYRRMD